MLINRWFWRLRQSRVIVESRWGICKPTSRRNGWNQKNRTCNTISSKRQRRIMPTNEYWRTEGSDFSTSPLFWFCCFIGCVLCRWAPFHLPGKIRNLGHFFSKILPVHCRTSAALAWHECCTLGTNEQHVYEDWELVLNLLCCVLETGVSYCTTPHSSLDMKSLAIHGAKAARSSRTMWNFNKRGEMSNHSIPMRKPWDFWRTNSWSLVALWYLSFGRLGW